MKFDFWAVCRPDPDRIDEVSPMSLAERLFGTFSDKELKKINTKKKKISPVSSTFSCRNANNKDNTIPHCPIRRNKGTLFRDIQSTNTAQSNSIPYIAHFPTTEKYQ